MAERSLPRREEYPYVQPVTSRWMDNDVYGHINNAHYYAYYDTIVNRYLVETGGLDIHEGEVVGYVVASACEYFGPVAYPELLEVGVRVEKLGTSSVRYGVALFRAGDPLARAAGSMVHVFVDRKSSRSIPIPATLRKALQEIAGAPTPAQR
jgi:acyl-CoA thioester hydrolase